MRRLVALDLRLFWTQHLVGLLTVLVVAVGAAAGNLALAWPLAFLWIVVCGQANNPLDTTTLPVLHAVLGVPRRQAVRARYLRLLTPVVVLALIGAAVAAFWASGAVERYTVGAAPDWWSLRGLLGATCVGTLCSGITLTLAHVRSGTAQQVVSAALAGFGMLLGGVPLYWSGWRGGNVPVNDALWTGPAAVPVVLAAVLVLTAGERLAERAWATRDL